MVLIYYLTALVLITNSDMNSNRFYVLEVD